MLIDKDTRKLLKLLNNSEPDFSRGIFSFEHILEISKMDEAKLSPIVKELEKQGLAEYAAYSSGMKIGIALTQRGKKYKELQRLESRERWKERIIGFVSGVLATVLSGLILELLSR